MADVMNKDAAGVAGTAIADEDRLGFYFDQSACIGCGACQIACKDKNDLPTGVNYRVVRSFEVGKYPNPLAYNYSGACYHCKHPVCVDACQTGAMHVAEDGTVQHDDGLCTGCKLCGEACPYDAIHYFPGTKRGGKCDSCKDLRDAGQNPACVDACVMRYLDFGPIGQLRAKHADRKLTDKIAILPDGLKVVPELLINPAPAALDEHYTEKRY